MNAVQNDIVVEWANKAIVDLIRKKIIKPAMNYPYEFLVKQIGNSEKIDFTDFLVEAKHLSSAEKESLINRFDNNIDAEEKINQFIN